MMSRILICMVFFSVFFVSCSRKNTNNKKLKYVEKSFKNKNLDFKGFLNEDSQRDSTWEYYNSNGSLLMSGKYIDGMKDGIWKYGTLTYNGSDSINWNIVNTLLVNLNIPSDWQIQDSLANKQFLFRATYSDASFSVKKVSVKGKSLDDLTRSVVNKNREITNLEVRENKFFNIKGRASQRLIQKIKDSTGLNQFLEQYIITIEEGRYYLLLSFIQTDNEKSFLFHELFSDLAFRTEVK